MFGSNLQGLLYSIPGILLGLTFHEYAHGKVAAMLGDPTPAQQGRLTLNPIPHLDPLGTLLLLVAGFGWAKPVQVNPLYFRGDRRRGMMYVGMAGPLMNIVLAYLFAVLLRYIPAGGPLEQVVFGVVSINIVLAVFNLIPVPPLDGSRILAGIVPKEQAGFIYKLESYGPFLLLLLVATGLSSVIIGPLINIVARFIFSLSTLGL
ncbi:MAG: site-2 protease family protein [Bacillota bacterium]